jgi:hypothetical protein
MKINVIQFLQGDPEKNEKNEFHPIYCSKNISAKNEITLVLFRTELDGEVINHFSLVKDINKLLRKEYISSTGSRTYGNIVRCLNCFSQFTGANKEENLTEHKTLCYKNEPQKVIVPKEGETIKFTNFLNKFKANYVLFYDFETAHYKPQHRCDKCRLGDNDCVHKTTVEGIQLPVTVSYLLLDASETVIHKRTYSGHNCVDVFLEDLLDLEPKLLTSLDVNMEMVMTDEDKKSFSEATHCHICEQAFLTNQIRVRDHCHLSSKFLGSAHQICNASRRERKSIICFAHNGNGFDNHFLLKKMGHHKRIKQLSALPYNSEKMRNLKMNSYNFLDSFSFLTASLDELVQDLIKNKHSFKILDQCGLYRKGSHLKKYLLKKGSFPFEYCTSLKRMVKTKKIPDIEYFFSKLTNRTISAADYARAKKIFKKFGLKNLLEYCELYWYVSLSFLHTRICVNFLSLTQRSRCRSPRRGDDEIQKFNFRKVRARLLLVHKHTSGMLSIMYNCFIDTI